jgi:hypothetical protein
MNQQQVVTPSSASLFLTEKKAFGWKWWKKREQMGKNRTSKKIFFQFTVDNIKSHAKNYENEECQ